ELLATPRAAEPVGHARVLGAPARRGAGIHVHPAHRVHGRRRAVLPTAHGPNDTLAGWAPTVWSAQGGNRRLCPGRGSAGPAVAERGLQERGLVVLPEGRLVFAEHGRAPDPCLVRWQDRLPPVWRRIAGGCHRHRTTAGLIAEGGF